MIPTMAQQIVTIGKYTTKPPIKELSPHNKNRPGGNVRAARREQIYTVMADEQIWTVWQLEKRVNGTTREISSALKVLITNNLVEIVDRKKINKVKICFYKRKG